MGTFNCMCCENCKFNKKIKVFECSKAEGFKIPTNLLRVLWRICQYFEVK